jgi:hypothetical protein
MNVVSDNKFGNLSSSKSPQIPSPYKTKSNENYVFRSCKLEVETKGLESTMNFFLSY